MIDLKKEDIRTAEELKQLGFPADEVKRYAKAVEKHEGFVAKLAVANEAKEWDAVLEIEEEINYIAKYLKYLGKHPKTISIKELQELPKDASDDSTESAYRAKVSNPATAMRAFCVMCMSGNVSYVRECEAVSCVFWPFRTGKNPLRGKVLPPIDFDMTIDPTEPEEEIDDESDTQDADQ